MKKNKRILGDYDLRLNVSAVSLDSFKSDKSIAVNLDDPFNVENQMNDISLKVDKMISVSLDSFNSDMDKVISFAKWLIMSGYSYNKKEGLWQSPMIRSIGMITCSKMKTGEELYSEFKKGDV